MRRPALLVAVLLLAATIATNALAFGTVTWIMGQNREHERITRNALGCEQGIKENCFQPNSISNLAGRPGTMGAVGAPDNVARGLMDKSEAHCDNGDFLELPATAGVYANTFANARRTLESVRAWMETHMEAAVVAARALVRADGTIDDSQIPTVFNCTFDGKPGRAKCNVLEELGLVLHAAQDFYSHTNWTDATVPLDKQSPTNPPGMNKTQPADYINLRHTPMSPPMGLISGCFDGWPEFRHCNAGPGGRVKHEFLNKDKGTIDGGMRTGTTPRGLVNNNFARAVHVAILDTREKWTLLQELLVERYGPQHGKLMICALTNDNPATTCGGQAQQSRSIFKLFVDIGVFIAAAGLLGGGFMLIGRGRRRRHAA